ncbi:MAG TPA: triose-phosphate isomerase [Phenylobacterium sp.]|uniref:triose-phosphate isomerase n=1 Tax=Phenylobacterium sp. TaxID=1871053 RepID=UPI002C518DFC|nr:triose-phosphate isomerase [Phenylobacterium sp.]HSV03249.1 triose-phosphate isomerase [Phenylobacterium sp.]
MSGVTRPLIVANWKMNGLKTALEEISTVSMAVREGAASECDLVVCPPATLIAAAAQICAGSPVAIGGQSCHERPCGAHTGDISAEMLRDAGAAFVIVGHSERRVDHGETDATTRAKAEAAIRAGLVPIICIGETRAQRDEGCALAVLDRQVANSVPPRADFAEVVVAYEPIWAIGAGATPTLREVTVAHASIRAALSKILPTQGPVARLLYGGSVTPSDAAGLAAVENVNGLLVGGASLICSEFLAITTVYD